MEDRLNKAFWWFLEPQQWWVRHLCFWAYRFNNYVLDFFSLKKLEDNSDFLSNFGEILLYIAFVYFHIWVLIPRFLFKKKVFVYILISICTLILFPFIEYQLFPFEQTGDIISDFHYSFVLGVETYLQVTGLFVMVEFLYAQKRLQELKNENLSTELAYLKSQINPHFLFNTLNNIAVLSEIYPEKVTNTIVELSNVLRFQLYESDKPQVSLAKDIENIRQYLSLEILRLNEVQYKVNVDGNLHGKNIAPLLLLPFIENAVKHGANPSGKVIIDISFKLVENTLTFTAENSKPPYKLNQLAGGIGLKNTQRRLNLLYPNRHNLVIEETAEYYKVVMTLEL
jgi:two-component system, LytTR family, sensor kinase